MEAVSVGGLKRARGGVYNGPEAAAAAATLKKLRLDAAAAVAAMNMPPTGHTSPLGQQQQQQQAAQGAANAGVADGQVVQVTGMCNSIDSVGTGEEEVIFRTVDSEDFVARAIVFFSGLFKIFLFFFFFCKENLTRSARFFRFNRLTFVR